MVKFESQEVEVWRLTPEGMHSAQHGSHEAVVFHAIPATPEGIPIATLQNNLGEAGKIGQNIAFKKKWITKTPQNTLVRVVENICDETQQLLQRVCAGEILDADTMADLKKRKLVEKGKRINYHISRGPQFSLTLQEQTTDLTVDMLAGAKWKSLAFKPYNLECEGIAPACGYLHPLMKVREEFRKIFLEMGFTEMPTNKYVESSFWNFDALFQPQQHPSREAHDTFFLTTPATSDRYPQAYAENVRKVHETGGFGSIGYRYDWKDADAQKNILRTHTTAVSTRMLYKLAQETQSTGVFSPKKYFSIDKVFRNETVDATHLAEFHQIEGLIADRNLTLGDLIGMLNSFFMKLGCTKLRFKPAYNPYTEPSMEIFSYHEGLGKWIEIGNSGMFRPEMLRPMGFAEDVRVIAWGLSLERPTMIKYKISNIRDLVGHKVDLNLIKNSPICRLDK